MTITAQRPPIWQMIKQAIESLGGRANHGQIIHWVRAKYGEVNEGSLRAQITVCTVNAPSRIHYQENSRPRVANGQYDFLFSIGRGEVVSYNPSQHGQWAIVANDGHLQIVQKDNDGVDSALVTTGDDLNTDSDHSDTGSFALESHLRDFLSKNLGTVEKGLKLFTDTNGRMGIEYPTATGPIDILAIDSSENFVVIELKLSRGNDRAVGQLLRYMGWITENLAKGNHSKVRGFLVGKSIAEGPRYAAAISPSISLLEYELSFTVRKVQRPKLLA